MRFPRGSAIGFFGMFGRSGDLRRLDDAFRAIDVHPRMVPEAVKLTIASLLREHAADAEADAASTKAAAEIVGYCLIGGNAFAGANDADLAADVERRIEAALVAGTSLDAKLVLLALHAGIMQPSVRDAFQLESADD